MPESKDPIVYRYSGADGESLTGIPARSLRQSDVDAMDADQKALLEAHVGAEHLPRHLYHAAEAAKEAPKEAGAAKAAPEPPASQNKLGAKAADQKKGDG